MYRKKSHAHYRNRWKEVDWNAAEAAPGSPVDLELMIAIVRDQLTVDALASRETRSPSWIRERLHRISNWLHRNEAAYGFLDSKRH
jgi:hypothetical protein